MIQPMTLRQILAAYLYDDRLIAGAFGLLAMGGVWAVLLWSVAPCAC